MKKNTRISPEIKNMVEYMIEDIRTYDKYQIMLHAEAQLIRDIVMYIADYISLGTNFADCTYIADKIESVLIEIVEKNTRK